MRTTDQRLRDDIPPPARYAEIAAPPASDGTVMVLIPGEDGGLYRRGPCIGWAPRPDDVEPARGDPCLVMQDDRGKYWVIAWTPAA